jgi:hypothetical protein
MLVPTHQLWFDKMLGVNVPPLALPSTLMRYTPVYSRYSGIRHS